MVFIVIITLMFIPNLSFADDIEFVSFDWIKNDKM